MSDVSQMLLRIESGDYSAAEQLLPVVYEELRKLAASRMAAERSDHTLQATALVHEAYLRLVDADETEIWQSEGHFFAAATEAMRRILIERARKARRRDAKRGQRIPLAALSLGSDFPAEYLLELDEALKELETRDAVAAQVVKLRFYAGLTMVEVADALGMALRTVERNWTYARTWLHARLSERNREPTGCGSGQSAAVSRLSQRPPARPSR